MRVPLPDGSVRELPDGSTGADLAADIGPGLARAAMAIRVLDGDKTEKRDGTAYDAGRIVDLDEPLPDGQPVEIVTAKAGDGDALKLLRHDIAHVLAESVLELYPGTKVSIGPPIAEGFYYDFEFPPGVTINEDDFPKIEAQMSKHVKAAEPFERSEVSTAEAIDRYLREDQPYKVELIEDLVKNQGVETVGIYTNGEFRDLCRGPHAPDTGRAKAFKLTSVAGAYWRGDANRQMLTRIYGTAFATKDELAEHLERLEEARAARPPQARQGARAVPVQRDLARLAVLAAERAWRSGTSSTKLWRSENADARLQRGQDAASSTARSCSSAPGHWHVYGENMYFTDVEGDQQGLKPMNCPAHTQLYEVPAPLLPRPADPLLRAGPRAPPRAVAARCTACCASATSPRTTPTSSAPRTRSRRRSSAAWSSAFAIYDRFGFEPRLELSTRPEKRIGSEDDVGPRRGGAAAGARQPRPRRTRSTRATARSTARRSTCT